jgi:flavin reductase (DIM6/NTAB) family NADH-FMN oxidoreductase RutF/rubredoxin
MDPSIDPKALWDLSYGMYLVTSVASGRPNGQIANTVFQVSAQPARVAVSINKLNLTHDCIRDSGVVAIQTLEEQVPTALIGLFGFKSGREVDKFAETPFTYAANGCPVVAEGALSVLEGRVVGNVDGGTHTVFIVELTRAEVLKPGTPLTYACYQAVRKGHSPRNAPTWRGDAAAPAPQPTPGRYRCPVCGYEYDPAQGDPDGHVPPGTAFADLPPGWTCPVCGAARGEFTPVR